VVGGEDLHHQIGSAMHTVCLNLAAVADNHYIRDKLLLLRQVNKKAIAERNALFPAQVIVKTDLIMLVIQSDIDAFSTWKEVTRMIP